MHLCEACIVIGAFPECFSNSSEHKECAVRACGARREVTSASVLYYRQSQSVSLFDFVSSLVF